MKLNLSPQLMLPKDTVTQTLVVYGAKGMGKTNTIAVLCEELARNGQKFSYLDPIGCGYGLRYAANGKDKGLDIVVLGGRHGDIPIEPTAGAVVADFVVNERVNVVIDISRRADGKMWKKGEKIRFVADYFERLFERQGEKCYPLHQLIDEAARFIPQLIPHGSPDVARCVGAIEQVVEEGRNVGIGISLITQRSARMNKSVSELAECMIAFRTVGPNSISAILDWLGEHIPKAEHNKIVEKLRSLPRGHALIVSPGWLKFEDVVQIRMRETFDSSATPTADRKLISTQPLAPASLEKYKAQMAETIEKAKAEDPKELKKLLTLEKQKIASLEKENKRLEQTNKPLLGVSKVKTQTLKAEPAMTKPQEALLRKIGKSNEKISDSFSKIMELQGKILPFYHQTKELLDQLQKQIQAKPLPPMQVSVSRPAIKIHLPPKPIVPAPIIQPVGDIDLNTGQLTILAIVRMLKVRGLKPGRDIIARWHDTPTKRGLHPTGGTYGTNLGVLRKAGLLNECDITAEGMKFAAVMETGFEAALVGLNDQCQSILTKCFEGQEFTRDTMAAELGVHPTGGTYGQNLSLLRTRGLLPEKGTIKLTDAAKA